MHVLVGLEGDAQHRVGRGSEEMCLAPHALIVFVDLHCRNSPSAQRRPAVETVALWPWPWVEAIVRRRGSGQARGG